MGLKPTYGRVSRYGVIAYGSSLDQVGPLTRTVEDAALVLSVIAGHDKRDSTSSPRPVDGYADFSRSDLKGVRLGVPREFMAEGLDGRSPRRAKTPLLVPAISARNSWTYPCPTRPATRSRPIIS